MVYNILFSTTGAVDIKVMEDYSTTSFFLGFIRFACKVGYPKMLMPDEGSQLVKDMQIDFSNLWSVMHVYHGSVMYSYSKDFLWNLMSFSYRIVTCFIVTTSVMHNIASSHICV